MQSFIKSVLNVRTDRQAQAEICKGPWFYLRRLVRNISANIHPFVVYKIEMLEYKKTKI